MGYNLTIGEAVVESCLDDEERSADVTVRHLTLPNAPLNSSDDHDNSIYPSYTVWAAFCRQVGLYDVFYAGGGGQNGPSWWTGASGRQRSGILRRHPGAVALTEDHYTAFKKAQDRYQGDPQDEGHIYNLRRLDWLVWWTRWALDNCQHPTFYNS